MPACCGRDKGCCLLQAAGSVARICIDYILAGAGGRPPQSELGAAGLLPLRHRKKRELLEQLTADGPLESGAEPGQEAARSRTPAQQSPMPMQDMPKEEQQAAGGEGQQPAGAQDIQQSSTEHHLLDRDDLHSPQQPGNSQAAVQELPNHHERPPGEGSDCAAPDRLQSVSQASASPDAPGGTSGAAPGGSPHMEGPAGAGAVRNRPAEAAVMEPTHRRAGDTGPHHCLHSSVGSAAQPWVDALVGLLLLQLLPCGCLWGVGWLVHQLLGPRALSPLHRQLAEQVGTGCCESGPKTRCLCTGLVALDLHIVGLSLDSQRRPAPEQGSQTCSPNWLFGLAWQSPRNTSCRPVC